MKKNLTFAIVLIVGAMITFYSCKKESSKIPNPTSGGQPVADSISVKDNRLVFASVSAYESYLNSSLDAGTNSSRISQYMNTSNDTLIEDDFLASILNDKNIIQIGAKAYKLDFKNELCYVLSDLTPDNLKLLENPDTLNGKIKVYTFDDEVLYVEDDEKGTNMKKKGCKDKGAKGCKAEQEKVIAFNVGVDQGLPQNQWYDYKYKAKHTYQRAGIFFSLDSKLKYMRRKSVDRGIFPWSQFDTDIAGSWVYEYKQRRQCNTTGNSISADLCSRVLRAKGDLDGHGQGKLGRIYASTQALSKYKVSSSFTIKIEGCSDDVNLPVDITLDDICRGYSVACTACK